jgi:hypothetical protein
MELIIYEPISIKYYECGLYSCPSHTACTVHLLYTALYCHVWPIWLYHIFPHYLMNGIIFEKKKKKKINIECKMCVLIFSTTFVCNICHSKYNSAIQYHKCTWDFMQSTCYSYQILIKFEFSRQIFEKSWNIKFNENWSSGSQIVPCGQTDGQTDMTTWTVAFYNFANVP